MSQMHVHEFAAQEQLTAPKSLLSDSWLLILHPIDWQKLIAEISIGKFSYPCVGRKLQSNVQILPHGTDR